jgi:hypothetical protein
MGRYFIPKISQYEKLPQGGLMTPQELVNVDQYDCLALMEHLFIVLEEDKLIPPLCDEMDLIPVLSSIRAHYPLPSPYFFPSRIYSFDLVHKWNLKE